MIFSAPDGDTTAAVLPGGIPVEFTFPCGCAASNVEWCHAGEPYARHVYEWAGTFENGVRVCPRHGKPVPAFIEGETVRIVGGRMVSAPDLNITVRRDS